MEKFITTIGKGEVMRVYEFAKELGISTKEFNSLLDKRATAIQEYGRIASQKSSLIRF